MGDEEGLMPRPVAGDRAPDFTVLDHRGQTVKLSDFTDYDY